jgi:hypothetical protein
VEYFGILTLTFLSFANSLLMTLKLSIPTIGQKVTEAWLATLPLDSSSFDRQTGWTTFYLQVVKIYATRILPECDELDSARSVVETNSALSHENKEVMQKEKETRGNILIDCF